MTKHADEGQAIVIMVFAIVAVAMLAGLALDSGRLYAQRRQTQNAADAIAMTGALELGQVISGCGSGSSTADHELFSAVVDIAHHNGIDYTSPEAELEVAYIDQDGQILGWVGGGYIPRTTTGIGVTAITTDTTTFMQLAGQDDMVTVGKATGMVGTVEVLGPKTGGLLPIGIPLQVVNTLSKGQTFYLMENNRSIGGSFCLDPNADQCISDASEYNAHRGWLNFNYIYNPDHRTTDDPLNRSFERNASNRGCGSNPDKSVDDGLQGWAGDDKDGDGLSDCPYPFPIYAGDVGRLNGDFIHGDPGARQSTLRDVITTYNHEITYVPIFDCVYTSDYMDEHLKPPEEPVGGNLGGDHWPRAGGGNHAYLYHIVGFAAVKITDPQINDHILVAHFEEAVIGQFGELVPTPGIETNCTKSLVTLALYN